MFTYFHIHICSYVYICLYIYIYMYTCIHIYMNICMYIYTYVLYMYIHTYIHIHYMYTCIYAYIHTNMDICMYVYIHVPICAPTAYILHNHIKKSFVITSSCAEFVSACSRALCWCVTVYNSVFTYIYYFLTSRSSPAIMHNSTTCVCSCTCARVFSGFVTRHTRMTVSS